MQVNSIDHIDLDIDFDIDFAKPPKTKGFMEVNIKANIKANMVNNIDLH